MATNPTWTDFYERVELAAAADNSLLAELLPGGHWEGREYRCASIDGGDGSSFGFNKDTGVWCDFAAGERGGVGRISLFARKHGLANGEAARQLGTRYGVAAPNGAQLNGAAPRQAGSRPVARLRAVKDAWRPVAPFADELKREHAEGVSLPAYPQDFGKPVAGWLYLDDMGRPWNYRIRFEKDGSKEYRPLSLCENERGQRAWRWKDLPAPRILWNVEKLARRPDAPVVVVEGEKTADAAERLLGPAGYVVVSWGGGAGNEHHSRWEPLLHRRTPVFLWPDFDDKGQAAMLRIAGMFAETADVRVVKPDPAWLEKTDLADLEEEGWDTERTVTWLIEHSAPAEQPITSDSRRPECSLATKDHGVLQDNVWTAVKELNRKAEGPFYFFGENGLGGELKSVRPNALGDRSLTTPDIGSLRAQITRDIYFSAVNSMGAHAALPEADLLMSLLSLPCEDLPTLYRFVRTPIFTKDKRLISTPGYDKASNIYYAPSPAVRGLQIVENPTDEDFQQAMAVVNDILVDFKFATEADRANAFALMLLPLLRETIDGPTPMHRVEAPAFGTGKSLFLTVALLPTLGLEHLMFLPETKDDEEWRKILVGVLRDGWPAILIDNARHLNSPALASLLTATVKWGARPLNKQDVPRYKIQAVLACTVNNPVWTIEIHRRMLPIRLDARVESPFERTGAQPGSTWHHPALVRYVLQNRGKILSALLTLARYGLDHGQSFHRTKGSYEAWAQVMGSVLEALGFGDFLTSQIKDDATVGMDGLGDLIEQLSDHVGTFDLDVAYEKACSLETLTLYGREDRARKASLGQLLISCRDQIRGGKVLRFLGKKNGKAQFRLDTPSNEE